MMAGAPEILRVFGLPQGSRKINGGLANEALSAMWEMELVGAVMEPKQGKTGLLSEEETSQRWMPTSRAE